jgi:hypothetical protein
MTKDIKVQTRSTLLQNCRLLEKCLESSGDIRFQDVILVWSELPSNVVGSRVAFDYIRSKWSTIYEK